MFHNRLIAHYSLQTAVAAAMLWAAPVHAQGDLLVAPTRIIITNGGSTEVVLQNIGDQTATYRIGLELRRMTERGELVEVPEGQATPAEQAALDMVRHAPRRIILPPGQPQAVRISARPPAELADGEYRAHLTFRAIPSTSTPEQDVQAQTDGGLSIRLTPIYGVSIPVFVRKGRTEATASLANPHVSADGPDSYLDLDLNRTGNRSLYGEVVVKSARGDVLFMTRGVAIYAEITHRLGHFRLTPEQAATLHGPVRIEYREMPENGGKLLAELAATLN